MVPTNQNYKSTPHDQSCSAETTLVQVLNPVAHHNQETQTRDLHAITDCSNRGKNRGNGERVLTFTAVFR